MPAQDDAEAILAQERTGNPAWWRGGEVPPQAESAEWELWQRQPLFPGAEPPAARKEGGQQAAVSGRGTGVEWGAGGVWAEPFDRQAAEETLKTLSRFWHGGKGKHGPEPAAGEASSGEETVLPQPGDGGEGPGGNGACAHPACSAQVTHG